MDIIQHYLIVNKIQMINLIILFALNAAGTTLGNLKTIFLSKQITRPVYFTTFLDAMIFAYAVNLIAGAPSASYIIAFATGKLTGVYIGEFLDLKLALGTVEVSIFKHPDEGILLADRLRQSGYSVTTVKGYGMHGKERLIINVVIPRRYLPRLNHELASEGKLNLTIKDVTKIYGKVGQIQSS